MIVHVLRRAWEAAIGPVLVAAGDRAIADAVTQHGGRAVLTDPALPSGSDRVHAALEQADPQSAHDVVINLQGDLPTLPPAYLAAVLSALTDGADLGTLAAPIESEEEARAPSVVKIACAFAPGTATPFAPQAATARALYFSRAAIPSGEGPLYHHIGLYAWRRAALARFVALPPSPLELREKLEQLRALEAGMTVHAALVPHAPFGVDTPEDLERARAELSPS